MATYGTEDIRNIALVGQAGAGKTTLVEALLVAAGVLGQKGSVKRGTTVCDQDPQEKVLGHSLDSAIVSLDYHGGHINLIDTPGYPDFLARSLAVLPAVETCAVVVSAATGIDRVTRQCMRTAGERGLDRLIIVNKIDLEPGHLPGLLAEIQDAFGPECLPINLPANNGNEVVDCFFQPEGKATDFSSVGEAHTRIVDQVVELDEALMERYLEQGQELSPEQLHDPFEKALREGHLVPVCFVSAETGAGLPELLEIFARLMPNPLEGNPPRFLKGEGEAARPIEIIPGPKQHVLAHVFKVNMDPFIGRLAIFRIHQGTVRKDLPLFVGDARKSFRVAHLYKLQGKDHVEVARGVPGDICAVAKVDEIHFDAVLHDSHDEDHHHLEPMPLPEPMLGLALEAKSRGDEQKISDALHKLQAEDPSLRIEHDANLNETVIRAQGELHMRVLLERLRDRYHADVHTRPPRIPYRETITAPAEGQHRHKKQTGGAGQFGEVHLRIEPLPRGAGFEFVDAVVGGVIPRQFIPAVEKGVRQAYEHGAIAGFRMQDIRVTVHDGKHHPVDSKEVAFVTAGRKAFLDAVARAGPVVLEPFVEVHVHTPSGAVGDVTADLSGRRGRISATEARAGNATVITCQVPLSEVDGYPSRLKSLTGGAGFFSMALSHYEPVPGRTQKQLMDDYRPPAED